MIDETTDASNREQVTLVLRHVTDGLQVYEELLGLYAVDRIEAATIVAVIKDVMTRMNLPIAKLSGQCYDGESAMSQALPSK